MTRNTLSALRSLAPMSSPDASRIAFHSQTALDGSWNGTPAARNVWIANADGSGLRPLTHLPSGSGRAAYFPNWSPDGTRLAYMTNTNLSGDESATPNPSLNLWTIGTDGTGKKALTQFVVAGAGMLFRPYYTSDGSRIIYTSQANPDGTDTTVTAFNLWTIASDGTDRRPLTRNTSSNNYDVNLSAFSRDGRRIYFTSATALDGSWNGTLAASNLWYYDLVSGTLVALTHFPAGNGGVDMATPSPDGSRLFLTSSIALSQNNNDPSPGSSNLWSMNSDGTGLKPVTTNANTNGGYIRAYFSPDGASLAVVANMPLDGSTPGSPLTTYNLWFMNPGTGQLNAATHYVVSVGVQDLSDGGWIQTSQCVTP